MSTEYYTVARFHHRLSGCGGEPGALNEDGEGALIVPKEISQKTGC